jgi:hypothetical protein
MKTLKRKEWWEDDNENGHMNFSKIKMEIEIIIQVIERMSTTRKLLLAFQD